MVLDTTYTHKIAMRPWLFVNTINIHLLRALTVTRAGPLIGDILAPNTDRAVVVHAVENQKMTFPVVCHSRPDERSAGVPALVVAVRSLVDRAFQTLVGAHGSPTSIQSISHRG